MIRTAGGWFRPEEQRGVMFGAGTAPFVPEYYLIAVNDLSVGSLGELDNLIGAGHKVLLDSGIFNLTNDHKRRTGCTMDEALRLAPDEIQGFDKLFDKYVHIATHYGDKLWGYIELDQGGEVNKRKTRAKLADLGLSPIPVYHPLVDSWEYFDELAENYDRICFGNVVQADRATRMRLLHKLWERHRQYPDLWVHILGLTVNEWCLPLPPDSCDSSTWLNGLRYPSVSLGSTGLKRVSSVADRGFMYDADVPAVSGELQAAKGTAFIPSRCRATAARVYADELEYVNDIWDQLEEHRARDFGEVRFPPLNSKENR